MSSVQIVCVDNSEFAYKTLDYFLQNIYKPGSKVLICHCPEFWKNIGPLEGPTPGRLQELMEETNANTKAIREKVEVQAKDADCDFVVLENNEPYKAIVDLAESRNASLIVIGCRGLGKIRRTLLGSVSNSVLHHAHCPVLVCKH